MVINKKNAITLIELVIFIAITAIATIPLLALFNYALRTTATNQIMVRADFLAEGLMEGIMDNDFYGFKATNESNSPTVYDVADATFSWFESGWHYRLQYRYINPNYTSDLGSSAAEIAVGGRSNFLRVSVEVWHQNLAYKKVKLRAILTPTSRRLYGEGVDSF